MSANTELVNQAPEAVAQDTHSEEKKESSALKVVTWVSVGVAVVTVGFFVGRELRSRYKFNRRTPYDFYDHAFGRDKQNSEIGLGI
jgi:hypothetical protein